MPDINTSNSMTLPYSLEAEQAVLGAVLTDPECMEEVTNRVKQEYFYLPQHRVIFGSMLSMYTGSKAKIDPVVIADVLAKEGQYDVAGGREYLLTLKDSVPSTANVETYAKIVEEQYFLRTLIVTSQEIIEQATGGGADANMLLDSAEQKIYDIRQGRDVTGPRKVSDVIINGVYDRLYKLTGEEKDQFKAIPSGFGMLDKYITGLNKSDFILVGARPAMGKTSFALNLAQNVTMLAKKKCIFFSLEMTKEQLAERLLAAHAGVPSNKLRTGELTDDEWIRLGNATGDYEDVELYLDDTSSITVPEIKSRVRRLKNVDIIIIDYLGLIQSATHKENRVQEVSEITRNLKMLAKDLNIPVICCAQLSRGTEGRGKSHKPQLSDLSDSGSIEQDADIVMFLYREDYYNKSS
ncbi:MAG: replicative DNA helicase, partial [Eubacterium sp.]|nr:replicative DNA helicase [Eubacterium sp.]